MAAHLGLLKDPFAQFVDAAIARVRRDVDLDDHAPEAITYLSKVVGRDLLQPEPKQASEESKRAPSVQLPHCLRQECLAISSAVERVLQPLPRQLAVWFQPVKIRVTIG